MLRIRPDDYEDFKQLVGELHGVSTWYNQGSDFKFVSIGTKNGLSVAVDMSPTSSPSGFATDFPDAIDVGGGISSVFWIDGTA